MTPRAAPEVVVVRTGSANLASVRGAIERLGVRAIVTADAGAVRAAHRLILPGVGSFGAAVHELGRAGLTDVLRERLARDAALAGPLLRADAPATLCICLGMQLLLEGSDESPGTPGLGIARGNATRFARADTHTRVPQMGWNEVRPDARLAQCVPRGGAYFANSFKLDAAPPGWAVATTTHGRDFISAMARGGVLACQFHPELSGSWGARVLARWAGGASAPLTDGPVASSAAGTLSRRIIPCLDVRDGRVVKGVRFTNLRDAGDPAELAAAYAAQGADELVMLDVSATLESRRAAIETVHAIRRVLSIPLTVGGGVGNESDASALLDAGADKVAINSAAVADPSLVSRLADRFGRQCVVVAIDAVASPAAPNWSDQPGPASVALHADATGKAARWCVAVRSGRDRLALDAIAWAKQAAALGAGEILLTSLDRDGTRSGYDLALVRAVSDAVPVPVIASGGAAHPDHLRAALANGADAVLAASIFHDAEFTVESVKRSLAAAGDAVRLQAGVTP